MGIVATSGFNAVGFRVVLEERSVASHWEKQP
jgi:hypothetical protein